MSKINDGGPAFPCAVPTDFQYADAGMALWDAFAIAALPVVYVDRGAFDTYQNVAATSYELADAMLKAREAKS